MAGGHRHDVTTLHGQIARPTLIAGPRAVVTSLSLPRSTFPKDGKRAQSPRTGSAPDAKHVQSQRKTRRHEKRKARMGLAGKLTGEPDRPEKLSASRRRCQKGDAASRGLPGLVGPTFPRPPGFLVLDPASSPGGGLRFANGAGSAQLSLLHGCCAHHRPRLAWKRATARRQGCGSALVRHSRRVRSSASSARTARARPPPSGCSAG